MDTAKGTPLGKMDQNGTWVSKKGRDGYEAVMRLRDDAGEVEGTAIFRFQEVERLRRTEFNVFLQADVSLAGKSKEWSGRINLASSSAREGVVRAFSRMFKGKEFDSILSDVIRAVERFMDDEPRAKAVWQLDAFEDGQQMLLDPFIKANAANLIFGDGGSCKTYLTIGMLYSLATGVPFLGFTPARKVKSLFINYEDSEKDFNRRMHQVIAGLGGKGMEEGVMGVMHYKPHGPPLNEIVPLIRKEIQQHGIEVLAVDSAAYACGAEIEKAEAAIRFFNALDDLGIASMSIGHIRKSAAEAEEKEKGQQHAIGSIFFHNAPRNIWNAVSQAPETNEEGNETEIRKVALFHRKFNDGPKRTMMPVEVEFIGGNRALNIPAHTVVMRPGSLSDWEDAKPLPDRILRFLKRGPTSRKAIDQEFSGESQNSLKSVLRRLKANGRIRQLGGDNGDYSLV